MEKLKNEFKSEMEKLKDGIKEARGSMAPLSLSAVSQIEKLAQKRGKNTVEERFKVKPDYAYPNTWLNREELRKEMNKKSAYFHDLRLPLDEDKGVGQLAVEVLQCFGIPKPDTMGETSAFCILVCGSHAFKTDVMPPVANPMWLSAMRRACIFPVHHAYARLYLGVFGQGGNDKKDGFAGRVVIDLARLRPSCTYDITLPLRQSAHVYSRRQRGAIRFRFHLKWHSERQAMLSYLPEKVPKIEPNESVIVQCGDAKSFQNVARTVHGDHMPGRFTMRQLKATVREINFTRIYVLRYLRKREIRNITQWRYPVISGFVFFAWMHSVYVASVAYVPGHLVTFLLLYLWKNYAYYGLDSPVQYGFLAPTWEEMFMALSCGTGERSFIAPLEMEMKDESAAKCAMQDIDVSTSFDSAEGTVRSISLKEFAVAFRNKVKVNTIRHRFKVYHDCFRGDDAVDFLVDSGYADSRTNAVALGRQLAQEMKLFEHVERKHDFEDQGFYYVFLSYDVNEYTMKTHRPWGKPLFRLLGFLPKAEQTEAEARLEMPYSEGTSHPRFTVKESLVIRSKESQRLLLQEQEMEAASALMDSTTQSQQQQQLAQGLDEFLEENDKNTEDGTEASDGDDEEKQDEKDERVVYEIKRLKKPPPQDVDFKTKSDRKVTDVLAEARHKVHGVLLHLFNDRVYRIDTTKSAPAIARMHSGSNRGIVGSGMGSVKKVASAVGRGRRRILGRENSASDKNVASSVQVGGSQRTMVSNGIPESDIDQATKDEYNKILGIHKYSHGNPWVAKVGIIVQPIVEIALEWLCLFRALFNVFTWRDPILSFWFSIIGPVLAIGLHLFPWRWVMGILGLVVVGPQNWILRVMRERRQGPDPFDPDRIVKKKRIQQEAETKELPVFSMYAPDNRPVDNTADVDPSNVRKVVVPYSQLMYSQRFYDWPPENEYARVMAEDAPTSDPDYVLSMGSISLGAGREASSHVNSVASDRSSLSSGSPQRIVGRVLPRIRRRKKPVS